MLDLKRVKEYIELGFDKEQALEMVKQEAEDAPEQPADKSSEEIKKLQEKIAALESKKEEEKEKEKDTFKEDEKEKPMDVKDAFKNLFC